MTYLFRRIFFFTLKVILCFKICSLSIQLFSAFIVATSGFGNTALYQTWLPLFNIHNYSTAIFLLEYLLSFICIFVGSVWVSQLRKARKGKFKRFPGNLALFTIFFTLMLITTHWSITLIFTLLYFSAKKEELSFKQTAAIQSKQSLQIQN